MHLQLVRDRLDTHLLGLAGTSRSGHLWSKPPKSEEAFSTPRSSWRYEETAQAGRTFGVPRGKNLSLPPKGPAFYL